MRQFLVTNYEKQPFEKRLRQNTNQPFRKRLRQNTNQPYSKTLEQNDIKVFAIL